MTETASASYSPTRLERPRDSAFQGVCAAMARATGTEPVLWRVLTVVLTLFGGLGLTLYIVGIVAIPREDEQFSLAHRVLRGPDRQFERNQVLLLIIAAAVVLAYVGDVHHGLVVAVALVVAFFWWRGHEARPAAPTLPPPTAPAVAWTPPPPVPPRPRSPLGPVTFSIAVVTAGVLALLGATGTDMPVAVPIAAALGIVGIGLVAGSFFGRSWGLFLLAVALTAALGVAAAAQPLVDDGVGERTWTPTASATYRLGAGKAVLDLDRVGPTGDITAHVQYGKLLVEVPAGLAVDVDGRTEYGDVEVFGKDVGGQHEHQRLTEPDATVHLHLSAHAGEVKVIRK